MGALKLLVFATLASQLSALPTSSPEFLKKAKDALQPILSAAGEYYQIGFSAGLATESGAIGVAGGPYSRNGKTVLTPDIKIPMGSATKLYTATALLRLQELGVLDLDATAASIVDPFLLRTNGTTLAQLWGNDTVNEITVRQLAGMRSGLADYNDQKLNAFCLDPKNFKIDISPYDYLHTWAPKQLLFPPGKGGTYSSIGFVVLGFVLAASTNQSAWQGFDQRMIIPEPLKDDPDLRDLTFVLGGLCSAVPKMSHQYAVTEFKTPGENWMSVGFEDLYDASCLNGWTMGNIAATPTATSAALYGIFGAKPKHHFLTKDSLEQMMHFTPFSQGWGAGMQYGLGCMNSTMFATKVDNKTDGSYSIFYGHGGADFGSLAPLHDYNPKLDVAGTVATTATQGMNCSLGDGNKNGLFQLMCLVWQVVTDIATDGKAQTQCGPAPWDQNARTNANSPPHSDFAARSHRQTKSSNGVTEPSALEGDKVSAQPPTHCAVKNPRQCVGQSIALNGDDCFHWRTFHSGFNGENWARCRTLWDDPCACPSVTCSPDGTRLLALHLRGHGVEGRADAGLLSGMTALEALDLSHNRLYGSLGPLQLRNLTALLLDNNLLSGKAPELDYRAYTAGCSIANNSFDCPLPEAAAQCHRHGEKSPTCQSMPVSLACREGEGRVYGNESIRSAFERLQQQVQQAESRTVGAQCGRQLATSDQCTVKYNWTRWDKQVDSLESMLRGADARGCFADFHKLQMCGPRPCTINILRNQLKLVPNACTAADRKVMLEWDTRPAMCIQGGDGRCSEDWSDPSQCQGW